MNNENFHPVLHEPPLAHALHKWDENSRCLTYEYNGRNIITVYIPEGDDIGFRHGSDGNLQSLPLTQQIYIMVEKAVTAKVTISLSSESVNMKPFRAGHEQAILGQLGRPLIYGVNGMYDILQDLFIDWHGCKWKWTSGSICRNPDGTTSVEMEVELGPKPWFINLRMHYYRMHLGYSYHKSWEWRPDPKPIAGWCSWEAFRRDVNQDNIDEVSKFFSETLKDYGFEYVQVDDGYQNMPIPVNAKGSLAEGWLCTNSQFPYGHRGIIDSVEKNGLKPGIWTNANITNPDFAEEHGNHLIKDRDGKNMLGEWIDYLLDCSDEALDEHVAPYYRGLKEMGYSYFKTDAIRHLLYDGLHEAVRQGCMTNSEAEKRFRAFMECARRSIGNDAYFLASWGVLSEVIGTVDACRIAMDANPTWAGIRMQLVETARWFHVQRILFTIDPDHICSRAKVEWVRSVCSLTSLSGGLYTLSDSIEYYDDERLEIIKRTLPPLECTAAETGPLDLSFPAFTWTKLHGFAVPRENPVKAEDVSDYDAINMAGVYPTMHDNHPFSSLWAFHFDKGFRKWCIAARFATVPLRASSVNLEDLGLKPDGEYAVFDFWEQEYLGRVRGELACKELKLGQCQILSLTAVKEYPQFIASSRHVSMDAVSVLNQKIEKGLLKLEISGVAGDSVSYWFHVPESISNVDLRADNAEVSWSRNGEVVKADIHFKNTHTDIILLYN
ncbi:MAG TPA: hypothetical protein GXX36_02590 [Clostridiaceae bacterium]|nr:hypothetical protein [Clostridiaceae bacterium]